MAPAVEYPNGKSRFETSIWKVFQPTPENQHLFDAAKALQGVGHRSVDFLTLLAESSGPNANHKKSFPGHTAQMYGVSTSFIESNVALFNIGLLVQAPNPVGLTVEKWAKVAWHLVIVIVIPSHDVKGRIGLGSPGKHFLIGDPNILSFHDKFDQITDILDKSTVGILRKLKAKNVWVNLPRPVRNGKGTCLQLACEWLIEVVEQAPGLHYNQEGEIESIDHFRRVQI
ncbi:hypothetical protein GGX14DRAFT_391114 [Mycena pura]|uniref:Uncharacterized protein n=1 Tax=Mycena pura TaxID=153505 RepID=A0AAD6YIX7_9AGAR|nr:hypothetical protein GGX14DRAFT_391114 [Mycena pura]